MTKEILFDHVFGKSTEGVALVAIDGTIARVNPAFSLILGYGSIELEGRQVTELIHVDDRHERFPSIQAVLDGRAEHLAMDAVFIAKSGRHLVCHYRSYPMHVQGEVVQLMEFIWTEMQDSEAIAETIQYRLNHLEQMLERYDGQRNPVMNLNIGDKAGGDISGRDKITNQQKIFYFIAAVFAVMALMLMYVAYLLTWSQHGGEAQPPQVPEMHGHE